MANGGTDYMGLVLLSVTWLAIIGQASRFQVEDTPSNGTPVHDTEDTTTMVDDGSFLPQNKTL